MPVSVLHLVGSPTSKFYYDLSVMYAGGCVDCEALDRSEFAHAIALVAPGGWSFPRDLSSAGIAEAATMTLGEALQRIEQMRFDVCVPHMFCQEGYTRYRALVELLQVELLGCGSECCGLTVDKFMTKRVLQAAGVRCPGAELLLRDECADVPAVAARVLESRSPP